MSDPTLLRRPFTHEVQTLLVPPASLTGDPPPLFVDLHGQGQTGARQARWMGPAVPPGFAAAFPDGFYPLEVRRPERPIRIGRAWYHYSTDDRAAFLGHLDRAVDELWATVDAAVDALGADPARVFLGGFSQGGYLTHVACLRRPERVAGWLVQMGGLRRDYVPGGLPDLSGKPVLVQQGSQDTSFTPAMAEEVMALLRGQGADVTLQTFDVAHVITPAMAEAARGWLAEQA